ncbi:hypothetical protein PoB_002295100 [Plakobranchus ocellatus]|uniref:Uncharacterized protein n=1 Tax=Plakobranchus ocellatus TaxID=259542 RepID=A0AAV3ZPK5_9GAST|nr:hypothetical protein PoB_002295100 [Plakobranchus ocellatus]
MKYTVRKKKGKISYNHLTLNHRLKIFSSSTDITRSMAVNNSTKKEFRGGQGVVSLQYISTKIYNAKARAKHQYQEHVHKANFADEKQLSRTAAYNALQISGRTHKPLCHRRPQHTMPFVGLIIRQSQKTPCIILYTEDQLNDVKRFCCPPPSGDSTVLEIDKTFNLGSAHVTVAVYDCLSVERQRTDDFPIFCGPNFLHGNTNNDREPFFTFLRMVLFIASPQQGDLRL